MKHLSASSQAGVLAAIMVLCTFSGCQVGRDVLVVEHRGEWPARDVVLRMEGAPPVPTPQFVLLTMEAHSWAGASGKAPSLIFLVPGTRAEHRLRLDPGTPSNAWGAYLPGSGLSRVVVNDSGTVSIPWPVPSLDESAPHLVYERTGDADHPFSGYSIEPSGTLRARMDPGWIGCTRGELARRSILRFEPEGLLVGPWEADATATFLDEERLILQAADGWNLGDRQVALRRTGDRLEFRSLVAYLVVRGRPEEFLWLRRYAALPKPNLPTIFDGIVPGADVKFSDMR